MAYRTAQGLEEDFFGIGLTSRKNLCLNPVVSREKKGKVVDSKCRNLTASWVRAKVGNQNQAQQDEDAMDTDQQVELCDFYEVFSITKDDFDKPFHIYINDRNWNQQILQILFQMVSILLKILKRMVKECLIVHITLYDAL
jgi:hypothetical protein